MYQTRGPAVGGVHVLMMLSVGVISFWWTLMSGLVLSVLASRLGLWSNGLLFWGANRSHPPLERYCTPSHRAQQLRLAGVSVRLLKIWCSWSHSASEFINLHLKNNSGTGCWPYVLWLLDPFPLLGFRAGPFNNICRWPMVFLHSYSESLILVSSGNA